MEPDIFNPSFYPYNLLEEIFFEMEDEGFCDPIICNHLGPDFISLEILRSTDVTCYRNWRLLSELLDVTPENARLLLLVGSALLSASESPAFLLKPHYKVNKPNKQDFKRVKEGTAILGVDLCKRCWIKMKLQRYDFSRKELRIFRKYGPMYSSADTTRTNLRCASDKLPETSVRRTTCKKYGKYSIPSRLIPVFYPTTPPTRPRYETSDDDDDDDYFSTRDFTGEESQTIYGSTGSLDSLCENEDEGTSITAVNLDQVDDNENETEGVLIDHLDIPTGTEFWIVDLLTECDRLLVGDSLAQHEAYVKLESHKESQLPIKDLCGYWWRFAKAIHIKAASVGAAGDDKTKKTLTFEACSRAKTAVDLNDSSANAHKWYAITLGCTRDYVSIKEQARIGSTFKKLVEKAIEINPEDPQLHYLLGRFYFDISQLSWMKRRAASTLYSTPPTSTPEEALKHFQVSENIGKPLKDNRLHMGKCYIVLKEYDKAAYWLQLAVDMPFLLSFDQPIHDEAVKLLAKYRRYLN